MGAQTRIKSQDCNSSIDFARLESKLRDGVWEVVANECLEILKVDPHQIGALELLAKAQWQGSQDEMLLLTLSKLIRLDPYEPGYFALKGAALHRMSRYGEAMKAYQRGRTAPGAEDAITALLETQTKLVSEMLSENRVFRIEYLRNPERACTKRGFELREASEIRQVALSDKATRLSLTTRPS